MNVTLHQQNQAGQNAEDHFALSQFNHKLPATLLPSHHVTHHPASGLNPLVDCAGYLFSLLGKINSIKNYYPLDALYNELRQELTTFEGQAKTRGYHQEYIIVCRYLLCAAFDDVIGSTNWGGQWESFSLLASFNQDTNHQEKFFTIMERAIKDPKHYIDLMEIMYLCLSLGYKGHYRGRDHDQHQLEQITNHLYHHIRNYRGQFSKLLSPFPLKSLPVPQRKKRGKRISLLFIFLVTASLIMIIFISLSYLMDVLSNEAYKDVFPREIVTAKTIKHL
jgi:type VI secretion system protein ImpK